MHFFLYQQVIQTQARVASLHSQQKQQQTNINTAMHAFLQSKLFSVSMAIFCPLYMVKENCCALTVNELTQSL